MIITSFPFFFFCETNDNSHYLYFAMISTPIAPNDIYSPFWSIYAFSLRCKVLVNLLSIIFQQKNRLYRCTFLTRIKLYLTVRKYHTKYCYFLYVLFSSVSSLLFSLSIGLNAIRLTDAIPVAIANFQSHCICIDTIMHKNSRKPDPIIQVCNFLHDNHR